MASDSTLFKNLRASMNNHRMMLDLGATAGPLMRDQTRVIEVVVEVCCFKNQLIIKMANMCRRRRRRSMLFKKSINNK